MTGTIGYAAILTALPVAGFGVVALVMAARNGSARLMRNGLNAALAYFVLASLAVAAMEYALVTHDFSVGYVAQVGSRSTPLWVTISSLWASLEGSILFWLWVLAMYTALVVWIYRHKQVEGFAYAVATLLGIGIFFLIVLLGPANPFERVSPVPPDGPGPNPLLQNHILMTVHPTTQYLGYVGFSVPFAFAVAALITGKVGQWWVRLVRRWTLMAWIFLTISIVAGGWWAYEVLGWGGYWAWDPVENASLMPWLTATAFFHSVMVQERREMLRGWNVSLIVATFVLTILGTFLTRSGILGSVHAFTESLIGPLFLGFIGIVLLFSTVLVLWRTAQLRTPGRLDSILSREAAFLVANLLFVALTFTVLVGTIFPLVAEAVRGVKVSVGTPYFNVMTVPLFAAVVFLMGVGPALPWRRTTWQRFRNDFGVPAVAGLLLAGVGFLFGLRGFWPVLMFILVGFAAAVMARDVVRGLRRGMERGWSLPGAALQLVRRSPRRYGGYIVHAGVLVIALAVTVSWNYKNEVEATLTPGEGMQVGDYTIRLEGLRGEEEAHRFAVISTVAVSKDGRLLDRIEPKMNFYPTQKQPIPTPVVRSSAVRDVFVSLQAFEEDGSSATLKVVVTPLLVWLWVGAYVMTAGTIVAVWPWRRVREDTVLETEGPTAGDGSVERELEGVAT